MKIKTCKICKGASTNFAMISEEALLIPKSPSLQIKHASKLNKARTYLKIANMLHDLELNSQKTTQNDVEEYKDLSFDVILNIFEFINFSCTLSFSRLLLLGPIDKPNSEHFSFMSKIFFGYQMSTSRDDIRLLFPSVTICDVGSETIYDVDGYDYDYENELLLQFLPIEIRSLLKMQVSDNCDILDLSRFTKLREYSNEGPIPDTILPDSIQYWDVTGISLEQHGNDMISLDLSRIKVNVNEDVPYKEYKNLKNFIAEQQLESVTLTPLLARNLTHLNLPNSNIELYPGFVFSNTIHFLAVNSITIDLYTQMYIEDKFQVDNRLRRIRIFQRITPVVWETMFSMCYLDDIDLRGGMDEAVARALSQLENIPALYLIGIKGALLQQILDDTPISKSVMRLNIEPCDTNYNIATIISNLPKLTSFSAEVGPAISLEDALLISEHSSLTDLYLQDFGITDEVAEVFFMNERLLELVMPNNEITGECLQIAAYNQTLTKLDISNNYKLEQQYIDEFVTNNTSLTALYIEGGIKISRSFYKALYENTTLIHLSCTTKDGKEHSAAKRIVRRCHNMERLVFYEFSGETEEEEDE